MPSIIILTAIMGRQELQDVGTLVLNAAVKVHAVMRTEMVLMFWPQICCKPLDLGDAPDIRGIVLTPGLDDVEAI